MYTYQMVEVLRKEREALENKIHVLIMEFENSNKSVVDYVSLDRIMHDNIDGTKQSVLCKVRVTATV